MEACAKKIARADSCVQARLAKGCHEGKADVSAEHATPEKSARISGANELEEWTPGAEEATGEGAQASYC
jgi:hypothetical protein